jgi:hypothetical protein
LTLNAETSSSKVWIEEFTNWLNTTDKNAVSDPTRHGILQTWQSTDEKNRDLKILFANSTYATKYANFFDYE